MSRIRFYLDEDAMDGDLVRGLRSRDIDVITAVDAGMIRRPDEDHLRHASESHRVLYSFNVRDFHEIHTRWITAGQHHAGIILTQQRRYTVRGQIRRLLHLAATLTTEAMRDRVEFLGRW